MVGEQYDNRNDEVSINRYAYTLDNVKIVGSWYDDGYESNMLRDMLIQNFDTPSVVFKGDYDKDALGFADNSFDTVTCFEVLEHLYNPLMHLRELVRILKPGGKLYVSTPDGMCVKSRIQYLTNNIMKYHIHEPSLEQLSNMANRAGLRYYNIKRYPFPQASGLVLSRFGSFNRGLWLEGSK